MNFSDDLNFHLYASGFCDGEIDFLIDFGANNLSDDINVDYSDFYSMGYHDGYKFYFDGLEKEKRIYTNDSLYTSVVEPYKKAVELYNNSVEKVKCK